MKKLFSLILVALISTQMWAAQVYAHYQAGSNAAMGKIGINMKAFDPTPETPAKVSDGYSYVYVTGTSTDVRLKAEAINGCTFLGWYDETGATISASAAYRWTYGAHTGSSKGAYAKFSAPSVRSSATAAKKDKKDVTIEYQSGSGVYTDNIALPSDVVDMGDAGYWCKYNIGAGTDETAAGTYYQWGSFYDFNLDYSYSYPTSSDLLFFNDAASFAKGVETAKSNGYCTPTKGEWESLMNNCDWTVNTTNNYYEIKCSTTGNSIKLKSNTGYYNKYSATGSNSNSGTTEAYYWTSSYNSGNPYYFKCTRGSKSYNTYTNSTARYAMFVRPTYKMTGDIYTLTITVGSYTYKYKGVAGQKISVTVNTPSTHTSKWADDNSISTASARELEITSSNPTYEVVYTEKSVEKHTVTLTQPAVGTGTLSATYNNGTIVSGNTYDEGTVITVTATPAEHYTGGAVVMQGETPVALTNNQFTLTGNVTISTNFVEDAKYTVNITTSENGTISVMNGSTPVNNGDQVYTGTVLTVTATGDTENHYEFKSWTEGTPALTNNQFTLSSDVTIGANFGKEVYTINFYNGETLWSSSSAAYGSVAIQPANPTKIVGNDEYAFEGWSKTQNGTVVANWMEDAIVTGAQNYYAVFSSTAVIKYSITISALTNGSVTLTCDGITVPAEAGVGYEYAEGKTIIVEAIPNKGYHFTKWNDDNAEISRMIEDIDANVTLTPTFAGNTPFLMNDEWEQDDIAGEYASYKNKVLDVTLTGRSFTVGQWATLSVPFDYTLTEDDGDLYKSVYKFNSMEMAGNASVFIDFVRTYDIKANEPYLVVPRGNVNNPTFYGVKQLEDAAEKTLTSDHNVYFVSSLWKQTISGNEYFYVSSNSQLRFAHSLGTTIKANRAFFHIEGSSNAPRRVTIVLDGVEVEKEIAEDGSLEDVQNVRKYMENGRLVIECNGVRMDATGARIN